MKCPRCSRVMELDAGQDRTAAPPCESFYAIVVTTNCICVVDITSDSGSRRRQIPHCPPCTLLNTPGVEMHGIPVLILKYLKYHGGVRTSLRFCDLMVMVWVKILAS